jgi:hypothetical protein
MAAILMVLIALVLLGAWPGGEPDQTKRRDVGFAAAMTVLVILMLLGAVTENP